MPLALLTSYSGELGGAERIALDWLQGLPGEVWLACPRGPMADAAAERGVRVTNLRRRRMELRGHPRDLIATPLRIFAHGRDLRRLSDDLGADLVIACGMRSAAGYLLVRRRGSALVFEHHDVVSGALLRRVVRALARHADLVVAPSETVAGSLAPAAARVVSPGTELERFDPSVAPPEIPEALLLGAIVPWKRPEVAVDALALARHEVPEQRLSVAGEPLGAAGERTLARLRARAAEAAVEDAIGFPGRVDAPAALARASCLLHCATNEPFGVVLVEAMAAGRPVVAPAGGGPTEVLDESCALFYPPGDPAAAARQLVRLAADPALGQRLGLNGRRRAERYFSLAASRRAFAAAVAPLLRAPPERGLAGVPAVVTVTRNSAAPLERLLDSLEDHLPGAEVVVVDCASSDGSIAAASRPRRAISVRVVALDENLGFGRATNLGLKHVEREVTLLCNPDVELLDSSLMALAGDLADPAGADALLAPLVLNPDGSRQDTVHPLPVSWSDALRAIVPEHLVPGRLGARLWPWRARSRRRVGWAVGCALLARTETLRALGPFDDRLFLYGEDLALGFDAARRALPIWFRPDARVLHAARHASQREFGGEPYELLAEARCAVVRDRRGRPAAYVDSILQAITFTSRLAARRVTGRGGRREVRQLRALGGAVVSSAYGNAWPRRP